MHVKNYSILLFWSLNKCLDLEKELYKSFNCESHGSQVKSPKTSLIVRVMKAGTKGGRPGKQLGRGSRTLSASSQPVLLPPGIFLNITYHNRETPSKLSDLKIYFTIANESRVSIENEI